MAGLLVQGVWKSKEQFAEENGKFERDDSQFRNWITSDNQSPTDKKCVFPAEKGRYHLYVSYACPWAHRTLIMLNLKSLTDYIDVSVVHPYMQDQGWHFGTDFEGATGDRLYNFNFMHQLYTKAKKDYTGNVTVPVLWDKRQQTIVSNESADIIRMFNTAFNYLTNNDKDLYPAELRDEIDQVNARVYDTVNNGVYKAGFATSQEAYDEEVSALFESLDWLENKRLKNSNYLVGNRLTEADVRLVTTLLRFDAVYHTHFKCNLHRLSDFPHLQAYLERLYALPEVNSTVNMDHIKTHYYRSHPDVNPSGIVPKGPLLKWLDH